MATLPLFVDAPSPDGPARQTAAEALARRANAEGGRPGAIRDTAAPGRFQRLLFESRVRREFAAWIETPDGRRVEAEVTRRARELAARGKRRGIAALFESIRYDSEVGLIGGGEYLLNNDFRAPLARLVMGRNPDLDGFFELRSERGRA